MHIAVIAMFCFLNLFPFLELVHFADLVPELDDVSVPAVALVSDIVPAVVLLQTYSQESLHCPIPRCSPHAH